MILATINDYQRISPLHPLIEKAMQYVSSHNLTEQPLGRITIDGDDLYINNSLVDAVERNQQLLEMHRKYIDIHILLQGDETIGWKPLERISHICRPYDDEDDCAFSDDKADAYINLTPGDIIIAYPEDAHAPIIGEGKIRKLIVKIRI